MRLCHCCFLLENFPSRTQKPGNHSNFKKKRSQSDKAILRATLGITSYSRSNSWNCSHDLSHTQNQFSEQFLERLPELVGSQKFRRILGVLFATKLGQALPRPRLVRRRLETAHGAHVSATFSRPERGRTAKSLTEIHFVLVFPVLLKRSLVAAPLPLPQGDLKQPNGGTRAPVTNNLVLTGGLAIPDKGTRILLKLFGRPRDMSAKNPGISRP